MMPASSIKIIRAFALPLFSICAIAALNTNAAAQSLNEDSLKASYILRFVEFIRWNRSDDNLTRIGVLEDGSLYRELRAIAERKSSDSLIFQIILVSLANDDLEDLDILYIGNGHQLEWPRLIERSRQKSIVTVGGETGFLEAGGLVEFVAMQNRLRFSLNLNEVESYNIGLSSKLVRLALP